MATKMFSHFETQGGNLKVRECEASWRPGLEDERIKCVTGLKSFWINSSDCERLQDLKFCSPQTWKCITSCLFLQEERRGNKVQQIRTSQQRFTSVGLLSPESFSVACSSCFTDGSSSSSCTLHVSAQPNRPPSLGRCRTAAHQWEKLLCDYLRSSCSRDGAAHRGWLFSLGTTARFKIITSELPDVLKR